MSFIHLDGSIMLSHGYSIHSSSSCYCYGSVAMILHCLQIALKHMILPIHQTTNNRSPQRYFETNRCC